MLDATTRLIISIDLKLLKAIMPTTTRTILDQISAEKTKISERLAQRPPGRRPTSAAAAEAKAPTAIRGRLGRPPKAATSKSAGRNLSAPSSRRACPGFGYRQDPTGTLPGVPQRSPAPYRRGGAAPYPRGTDPGARRVNFMRHPPRRSGQTPPPDPRPHRSAAARFSTGWQRTCNQGSCR